MTDAEFRASLAEPEPPATLPLHLQALWWIANSNWQRAHDLIDKAPGQDCAWVHAHLHRIEGDEWNANYWYNRAGRANPNNGLSEERRALLKHFLD